MTYEIADVLASKTLAAELGRYARACSFQGTGSYLADLLSEGTFQGEEKVFAAVSQDKIIGFSALLKECCCIEGEEHSPWLDFLFVGEEYRNCRIGASMVENICGYARELGYKSLYLCTVVHMDYYAKLGFRHLYATNYFNGGYNQDKLCVMEKMLKEA